MSEMIERVALAISMERDGNFEQPMLPVTDYDRELAVAAIKAMREPTEAMIDRFVSRALCVSISGEGGWSEYARAQWQTMIDAALVGEG